MSAPTGQAMQADEALGPGYPAEMDFGTADYDRSRAGDKRSNLFGSRAPSGREIRAGVFWR